MPNSRIRRPSRLGGRKLRPISIRFRGLRRPVGVPATVPRRALWACRAPLPATNWFILPGRVHVTKRSGSRVARRPNSAYKAVTWTWRPGRLRRGMRPTRMCKCSARWTNPITTSRGSWVDLKLTRTSHWHWMQPPTRPPTEVPPHHPLRIILLRRLTWPSREFTNASDHSVR